ncbi:MAG: type II toxin-antitoxin system VapC family toxin [Candidatus Limnocylindrales bacterium]
MSGGLLDTSVFIASESGRHLDIKAIPGRLRVSVITIGELRLGVLSAAQPEARARRLATLDRATALEPAPVTEAVAESWALLRVALRAEGRSMPVNDSWIAATAMSLGLPVVTQDADYVSVPGLKVIRV